MKQLFLKYCLNDSEFQQKLQKEIISIPHNISRKQKQLKQFLTHSVKPALTNRKLGQHITGKENYRTIYNSQIQVQKSSTKYQQIKTSNRENFTPRLRRIYSRYAGQVQNLNINVIYSFLQVTIQLTLNFINNLMLTFKILK